MRWNFPPGDTFDPDTVTWVTDAADLERLISAASTSYDAVVDLETTGLDEHAYDGGPFNRGYEARIVLASFTLPQHDDPDPHKPTTWLLPLSHPDGPWHGSWRVTATKVFRAMQRAGTPLSNQNLKFDCRWIYALCGVDLTHQCVWDTAIASHLLDENISAKLKVGVPRDIPGVPAWDEDMDFTEPGAAERADLELLGLYAARDTYWTWRWKIWQRAKMWLDRDEDDEWPMFREEIRDARIGTLAEWCAMPQSASLTSVEQNGILFDEQWATERREEFHKIAEEFRVSLSERYGKDPKKQSFEPVSGSFKEWAQAAVDAGDLRITAYTKPKKGPPKPSWNKSVLQKQAREGSEVAANILEMRQSVTKTKFLRSWLGMQKLDGKIYANYNQGTVVTGRLSSSNPNMQNVTKSLKPAFVPSPGHVIVDLDFSQIELRIAAFIAKSAPMLEAYQQGRDLHRIMAASILNKQRASQWQQFREMQNLGNIGPKNAPEPWIGEILDPFAERWEGVGEETYMRLTTAPELPDEFKIQPEDVSGEHRQAGKSANFGLLYGMGAMGFRTYAEEVYGVFFTMEEAYQVHETFFELWDGLRDWHIRSERYAQQHGEVISPIGRVRRVNDIYSDDPRRYNGAVRVAINAPVQGFASDMMQIAAAGIGGYLPKVPPVKGMRLLGTVHDSIFGEVPEDRWEKAAKQAEMYMTQLVPKVLKKMGCNFTVPLGAGVTVGTRYGLSDVASWES